MTTVALAQLFRDPDRLLATDFSDLERLAARYPYSANLQLLLALHAELSAHPDRERYLNRAASVTFDREHLYDLLHGLVRQDAEGHAEESFELMELDELPEALLASHQEYTPPAPAAAPAATLAEPAHPQAQPIPEPTPSTPPDDELPLDWPAPTPQIEAPNPLLEPKPEPAASAEEPKSDSPTESPSDLPSELPEEDILAASPVPEAPERFRRRPISSKEELRERLAIIRRRHVAAARAAQQPVKRIARRSLVAGDGAISVTLAEVFERQGQYQNAIQVYKKLALANPEKGPIFAALIKELQRKIP